jgi:predicted nuclease of predicted toxin-antitoxin system
MNDLPQFSLGLYCSNAEYLHCPHYYDPRIVWGKTYDPWIENARDRCVGPFGSGRKPGRNSGGLSLSGRRRHNSSLGVQLGTAGAPRIGGGVSAFKFIVDEMLPQHLSYWLREQGYSATHVELEKLGKSQDNKIWDWAKANDAVVISKDRDFRDRLSIGQSPRVVWIRCGNTRKTALITMMSKNMPEIVNALDQGEWLIEITDPPS